MAMIVVFSLIQNVYMWNQEVSAEDRVRLNEVIAIDLIYFDVYNDLIIDVRNTGSVDSHLVAVWIESMTAPNEIHRFSVDEYVPSDLTKAVELPSEAVNTTFTFIDEFKVTVFTEFGNSVTETYTFQEPSPLGSSSQPLGQLGVFRINWFYCRYSSLQNPAHPIDGPVVDAMMLNKTEEFVAFYLKIKNAWDHPCTIQSDSFLALTSIVPPVGQPNFFLVQAVEYPSDGTDPTITIYDEITNPVILYPNQTSVLVFASEESEDDNWKWDDTGYPFGSETTTEGSGIQIALIFEAYEFDSEEGQWVPSGQYLGQTISTQAILLREK
jgi:hypothetical protein